MKCVPDTLGTLPGPLSTDQNASQRRRYTTNNSWLLKLFDIYSKGAKNGEKQNEDKWFFAM